MVRNISLQYERKVAKRISVAANVHFIPFGKLPLQSSIEKAIDDPTVAVDKANLGSFGFIPELRFYVGKRGALHGFYLAPFANYTQYKTDLPINYSVSTNTQTSIFNGNVTTITGGLLLGAQFKLGKSVYLDWWILGPNYGSAKGDLTLNQALSAEEQAGLTEQIEDLQSEPPFDKLIESYSVNGSGAIINAKGPWGGLRGLGFNLGISF